MRRHIRVSCMAAITALIVWLAPSLGRADDALKDDFYRSLGRLPSAAGSAALYNGPAALLISGVIGPGAYEEFRDAIARNPSAIVVLDGPGGFLGEALLIGEEIRRRRLDTLVAQNRRCASACAVVYLSGRTKYLGSGAAVGLHAASYADGRADAEATEVMAAYLRQVGVPTATLRRMARTAPSDIRWLTADEKRAIGIRPYARR